MPRDRINSVITHLEAAHIAYARVHGNLGYIQKRAGWMAIENSVSKDVWVCCLMALCYAWLGDPKMAAHSLNLANRAFINQKTAISLYASNAAERLASAALLTMSVFNIMSYNPKELIAEEDFKQFRRSLNESSNQQ